MFLNTASAVAPPIINALSKSLTFHSYLLYPNSRLDSFIATHLLILLSFICNQRSVHQCEKQKVSAFKCVYKNLAAEEWSVFAELNDLNVFERERYV